MSVTKEAGIAIESFCLKTNFLHSMVLEQGLFDLQFRRILKLPLLLKAWKPKVKHADDEVMNEATILDRPVRVKTLDKSNMLEACERLPDSCRVAIKLSKRLHIPGKIRVSGQSGITFMKPRNLVVAGMGGSAIGGEMLKDWLRDKSSVPVEVSRDYSLPAYVDERSLVIAISYSGETEETLSAFVDAIKRRCMVLTLSSGGHLEKFSKRLQIPHLKIPSDFPAPRAAIGYLFFPLVILMEKFKIVQDTKSEIDEALEALQQVSTRNALKTPLESNNAKRLALEIGNSIPVVCGFNENRSVARRLKCQFNENSKVLSKFETFPELNHNEIVGWEAPRSITKHFSAIFLRDSSEPPRIRSRIEMTKEIAMRKFSKVLEIHALGQSKLAKILSAVYIGDFASIYLALLREVDPTPTKNITYLKRTLKKQCDKTSEFEEEIKRLVDNGFPKTYGH
ncbi:MAG: bifunctional phosphoglucose/phosphomannose isomerase [Candidatus Bathyarchaeota archaeon]|nr:bifunctional phosphoglucose/phosphomannose isomerase [Candidatus Bathyarchaeota archaeon]